MPLRNIDPGLDFLWEALGQHAGECFRTAKGLEFRYCIRGNEMFVDRREKSITRATVELAYSRALAQSGLVPGPKSLNCFGASYLYPVFLALGIIRKP